MGKSNAERGNYMIAIGCDHAAVEFKNEVMAYLTEKGIAYKDFGCAEGEKMDYPNIGESVAIAVARGEYEKGMLFCGTGVGISISANKVRGVRAVVCSEPYSAKLSREHNDTNILAMGARVVGIELAKMIIDAWLSAEFVGGRHGQRVDMISEIENR